MHKLIIRRDFLKRLLLVGGGALLAPRLGRAVERINMKSSGEARSTVYRVLNGEPAANLAKLLELMGGVERLVGVDDLVVIKPNVQWWNQGAPNLAALKALVELIFNRAGGFRGEVVVAENCHRGASPWLSTSSGWAQPFQWNSDLLEARQFNDLGAMLKTRYGDRFSVCHWIDVQAGGRRVLGPHEGSGYVYCDGTGGVPLQACDNGGEDENRRETIMTYPVFVTDRGTVIDFKDGVWEKGSYTEQPLRFINLAALNHHSTYCGMTSVIKNYMGITDLSGGPDPANGGRLTGRYFNFHSFPFNKWSPGPEAGMLGKAIGTFMKTVRKADLNIVTAEWVGLASRVEPPVARTRAVLASTDPIALDYHSAKYVLFPNSKLGIHNPDHPKSPVRPYLAECMGAGGGALDESNVEIKSFDLAANSIQTDTDLCVIGDCDWGSSIKTIFKYILLRLDLI
jgi:hypothetical protein